MLHTLFIRESLETMGVTTPTHSFWRASRMRVHRNAKTTPKMRQLIVTRATTGLDLWPHCRGARDQRADRGQMDGAVAAGGESHRWVVAPASAAAPTRRPARSRDPAAAPDPRHGLADQHRPGAAAIDGDARAGAGRVQSGSCCSSPRRRCNGMSGQRSATCCTSI